MNAALAEAPDKRSIAQKAWSINWLLVLVVIAVAAIGVAILYSVAGGSFQPWAERHMLRFMIGLALLLMVAILPMRLWLSLAYPIYLAVIALLVAVLLAGEEFGGAQRWLTVAGVTFQPSELLRVALVLAIARYYQSLPPNRISHPLALVVPLLLIAAPVALVLKQPDLGTAALYAVTGIGIIFLAGVSWWYFAIATTGVLVAAPYIWSTLHSYQKQRILTFLEPASDPLGRGYQVYQSKIALGSGGFSGKGFMNGSQSQLDFLPEKQTDFIFTVFAEEMGFVGSVVLFILLAAMLILLINMAMRCRHHFGRLLIAGVGLNLFLYSFVNIAMVMGLVPVVGAPLPLVSYGGTSLLATLLALGFAMNAFVHRKARLLHRDVHPLW